METYKGAITLILIVLILFGIFVAFATGVVDPLVDRIGEGFSNMVNSVFDDIPSSGSGD